MSDPTGTSRLRRSFLAEGGRRLSQLRSQTHRILVEHDLMKAKGDPLAQFLPHPGERLSLFAQWFEGAATRFLLQGEWWEKFLERAYQSGGLAGRKLTGDERDEFWSVPAVYREMARREITGIVHAMAQQVARQAGVAALGKLKPGPLYRSVLMVMRKTGSGRMKTAVNTITVQLHNAGRLRHYRAMGIKRVGIVPERLEPPRPSRFLKQATVRLHDHLHFGDDRRSDAEQAVREAEAKVAAAEEAVAEAEANQAQADARVEVAQSRVETETQEVKNVEAEVFAAETRAIELRSEDPNRPNYEARVAQGDLMVSRAEAKLQRADDRRAQAESALAQAEAEAEDAQRQTSTAQADLVGAQGELEIAEGTLAAIESGEGLVNVQTAGDEKVCPECIALAAGGPYSVDEADTLLPVHPNCRCALVPVEEPAEASA